MNILVVDNDKSTVETIRAIITSRMHYNVDIAYGGEECLDMMRKNEKPYDLLILDIMMPGVSGIDVCEAMSKDERLKNTPALLASALPVSSEAFLDSLEKLDELSIVKDVLEKPFSVDGLTDKIKDIIGKKNK